MGILQLWPSTGITETRAHLCYFLKYVVYAVSHHEKTPIKPGYFIRCRDVTQLSLLQAGCSKNRKICFFLTSSSSQAWGPDAAASAGLQPFSEHTGRWLRVDNLPRRKGKRVSVAPVSHAVRGAQESAEERARPSPSKGWFGRGEARWEGGTGGWCHSRQHRQGSGLAQPWPPTTPLRRAWK